ncbi:kinase-like domain-containing protein [Parasitella parasitica]|nr:kinase-like domain-containing protein [Parasitella parasitica]
MLYGRKKKSKLTLRKLAKQPNIGVIETTMLYRSADGPKERLISVFTLFVEEPSRHLILIRFYEDFEEFDKRIKRYYKKFKVSLPKLRRDREQQAVATGSISRRSSISSNLSNQSNNSLRQKLLYSFSKKSTHLLTRKSNSDKIERYLRHCVNDPTIQSCSLFKEFLQPQRDEDNTIPKELVQSLVEEQHISMLSNIDSISNNVSQHREINTACGPTPPPDKLQVLTPPSDHDNTSFLSYSSFSIPPPSSSQRPQSFIQPHRDLSGTSNITSSSFSTEIPVTIQDFQLIKVIGRGCMGKVLLVRHRSSSRLLALKAISKKAVVEQSQIIHIKAEQQILADIASIHHPFLIKLHYSFQDLNQLFLVLDYHVGGDLATQLRVNHCLPPERCRFYTAEIVLGIQELHRLGILYRDLKPENILLTADGHLVLTDFGLSKQFYDGLSLEQQRTDTFCGTAEYLAPEILNEKPYSYEVDYWSMGTILFEMLTGITPFWAENRDDMYRRIRQDPLQFPEFIDIETADFIARLLKRDPHKRLGSGPDGPIRVRSDPYFEFIDWNLIYAKRIKPPYIPKLYSETDFSHFDSEFLRMTPRLSPVGSEYMLSQSLDHAFEGYSYTNREDTGFDSPPSELYSMSDPPLPVTLMDTTERTSRDDRTRYFVYNGSDDVMPYDDYADSVSSSCDDIRSIDFVRQQSNSFQRCDEDDVDVYYPPRPARPVTRSTISETPPPSISRTTTESLTTNGQVNLDTVIPSR